MMNLEMLNSSHHQRTGVTFRGRTFLVTTLSCFLTTPAKRLELGPILLSVVLLSTLADHFL